MTDVRKDVEALRKARAARPGPMGNMLAPEHQANYTVRMFAHQIAWLWAANPDRIDRILAALAEAEQRAEAAEREVERLTGCLKQANEQAEHFEREWYLTKDRAEAAEEALRFVERWANHHGQKLTTTPAVVLSVIQHYPPILAITRSYADGKAPATLDPFARAETAEALLREVRACLETESLRGAIADTLWFSPHETLFDHIDAHLSKEASNEA